ncbi:MAG: transketolase [Anaerolineales bacterium]|jgi:transketolase|nr:transketolase [Anaerolineales bacterium]
MTTDLEQRALNAIRFLSADAVQQANSGHPGLPMGAAAIAYTVWMRHLRHNPQNPQWPNRDRFILSGGHGSALLYSLLHLTGYDLALDELKRFRQWGSLTPGHPEFGLTPGIETTTGPLGAGFANGVGMAIAEAHLAAEFNTPQQTVIDHYTYAIVTDGDLMEGVSSEAASLAGHLKLGKLIYLYDDNQISIDGSTALSFTEDRAKRFEAYHWHVQIVSDGNDIEAIDAAIQQAKLDQRPSIIMCRTVIGFGLPNRAGTSKAHGEPPGDSELNGAKEAVGWPLEPRFYIPEDALAHFRESIRCGAAFQAEWQSRFDAYCAANPEKSSQLSRRLRAELPAGWDADLPVFPADEKGMASRAASGKVLNAIAARVPELLGGSADLAPSNNTWLTGLDAFQHETPAGRNFHFGVREHAMGVVVNGMAYHGGLRPFAATFLVFADYMRPALRIAALSHLPSIFIFTHDSIGVGEDGPTHQPVEQIASLRAIPNLTVIRPADANETTEAWKAAMLNQDGPTALILTRQNLATLNRELYSDAALLHQGAYVLADMGNDLPELILMASGSEVALIVEAGTRLAMEGVNVRLVSVPSWELFEKQDAGYRESVLPAAVSARVAVEAGIAMGWEKFVGQSGGIISLEHYGASAPAPILFREFGFTVEHVMAKAREVMR